MNFPQVCLAIESVAIHLNVIALTERPTMVMRIGELTIMFSIILFSPKRFVPRTNSGTKTIRAKGLAGIIIKAVANM